MSPTRVTLLLVLLTATVVVASLLGYEAVAAARAERMTAERVLGEYAAMAAWELHSSARKTLDGDVMRALGVVTAGAATSPFEPPIPFASLRASADGAIRCTSSPLDTSRAYSRLDLATGRLAFDAEGRSAADREAHGALLREVARTLPAPESPYVVLFRGLPDSAEVLVVGVRYARLGTPVALYAFTACTRAIEHDVIARTAARHRLLPAAVARAASNDSLLAIAVRRAGGEMTFALGTDDGSPYRATVNLPELGGLVADVALRRDAASRLLVATGERSYVALLVGLLALSAALAAVALVQIRREHELARQRTDFTSSVSHELRTPLAQILLFGETLSLGRTRTPAEQRRAAETIVQEARRLMQMVDNILRFASTRRGAPALEAGPVVLAPLLRDVLAGFSPLAQACACHIAVDVDAELAVQGDAGAMRQITLNLLDNALKYGAPAQVIRVRARERNDVVRLTVEDEGAGIARGDRERIWLPYVRLTENGRGRGGTGLGLAVVRELAEAMGGRTWVEDAPHRDPAANGDVRASGAAFVVELPRAARRAGTNATTRGGTPAEQTAPA